MDQIPNIQYQATAQLPTRHGAFTLHAFTEETASGVKEHAALVMGAPINNCLVRVHSSCVTGDVFGSTRCDCGDQFAMAQQMIAQEGSGLLIYLDQEGRDIGLINKIMAYALQDDGADTVEANIRLGLPVDARKYYAAAHILQHFDLSRFRLLTNNPTKIGALRSFGFSVSPVLLCAPVTPDNRKYIQTKRDQMGHAWTVPNLALH